MPPCYLALNLLFIQWGIFWRTVACFRSRLFFLEITFNLHCDQTLQTTQISPMINSVNHCYMLTYIIGVKPTDPRAFYRCIFFTLAVNAWPMRLRTGPIIDWNSTRPLAKGLSGHCISIWFILMHKMQSIWHH